MTAQIPDHFMLDGSSYALVDGVGLFSPLEYGLEPIMTITSCWRGYVCTYAIQGQQLVLDTLEISLRDFLHQDSRPAEAPLLNGVASQRKNSLFTNCYSGVAMPLTYSGSLQIASDFIQELYVHMGFHPAWKYRTVLELSFMGGELTGQRDVSAEMEQVRKSLTGKSF
jgi:hypothetical protein